MKKFLFSLLLPFVFLFSSCGTDYTDRDSFEFSEFIQDTDQVQLILENLIDNDRLCTYGNGPQSNGTLYMSYGGFTSANSEIQSPIILVYGDFRGTGQALDMGITYGKVTGNTYSNPTIKNVSTCTFSCKAFYYLDGEIKPVAEFLKNDDPLLFAEIANEYKQLKDSQPSRFYFISSLSGAYKKLFKKEIEFHGESYDLNAMDTEIENLKNLKNELLKETKVYAIEVSGIWAAQIGRDDAELGMLSVNPAGEKIFDEWLKKRGYSSIDKNSDFYKKALDRRQVEIDNQVKKARIGMEADLKLHQYAEDVVKMMGYAEMFKMKFGRNANCCDIYGCNQFELRDSLHHFEKNDSIFERYHAMLYYKNSNFNEGTVMIESITSKMDDDCISFDIMDTFNYVRPITHRETGAIIRYDTILKRAPVSLRAPFATKYWPNGTRRSNIFNVFNIDKIDSTILIKENFAQGLDHQGNKKRYDYEIFYSGKLKSWVLSFVGREPLDECNKEYPLSYKELPANHPSSKAKKVLVDKTAGVFGWKAITLKSEEEIISKNNLLIQLAEAGKNIGSQQSEFAD